MSNSLEYLFVPILVNPQLPINDNLPEGATELSPDELQGLIPDYISTRRELNEFEKQNIMQGF